MHIVMAMHSRLPAVKYGGSERLVVWLARALVDLGHKVTFLAAPGSTCDFASVEEIRADRPLSAQVGPGVDIVHGHSGHAWDDDRRFCQTFYGNLREPVRMHPNTVFLSSNHAKNHNGRVFVHGGIDTRGLPAPDLAARGGNLVFLAKAAWRVKNVRGAIAVARRARVPIDVLGGNRLNFKMGFRLTLDPNARFHGMVDDVEKVRYLRPARALLFPVRWNEPFGVAIVEAMAFGLPVLATPYGSLPELVPEEVGVLSTEGAELAEAAMHIERFDRRAVRDHFERNFTAGIMARRYVELYERIAAGEQLHDGPIEAKASRDKDLFAWRN